MKLKSKKIVRYKGEVIDLCVSNSHTYNVEGIAVHNSGGGSLVAYVLYITDLDPIFWDLPFARFLSVYRKGAPDIDCVHHDHLVVLADGSYKRAGDVATGDQVIGGDGQSHPVTATYVRKLRFCEHALSFIVEASDGTLGHISTVPFHKFVLLDGTIVQAADVVPGDRLMSSCGVIVRSVDQHDDPDALYVDMTVDADHRFGLIPFDVVEDAGSITRTYAYGS